MTISMPDSIVPANMPHGYPAYLAYVDGDRSRDADQVRALFPGAKILTLTVLGGNAVADGCDREPGDLSPLGAALWLRGRVTAGAWRPVLYDSRDDIPGTLGVLAQHGVARSQVRLWSAHYGAGQHICGPSTCSAPFQADGTQWTDSFPGVGGAGIDMSLLEDGFFGGTIPAAPAPGWQEALMQALPVVRQGSAGGIVRTVQGLCVARGQAVTVDGSYGPQTAAAVAAVQRAGKVAADSVVGPATWPVLLGV